MRMDYKVRNLPFDAMLVKEVSLTISPSKFHIDQYFPAYEITRTHDLKDAQRDLLKKLQPGVYVQFKEGTKLQAVLPGLFAVYADDVLCILEPVQLEE